MFDVDSYVVYKSSHAVQVLVINSQKDTVVVRDSFGNDFVVKVHELSKLKNFNLDVLVANNYVLTITVGHDVFLNHYKERSYFVDMVKGTAKIMLIDFIKVTQAFSWTDL